MIRALVLALTLTLEPSSASNRRAIDRAWQEVELGAVILGEAVKARPDRAAAQLAAVRALEETPVDAGVDCDQGEAAGRP